MGMLDTTAAATAGRDEGEAGKVARIRDLLASADRSNRAPGDVLDEIARLVGDRGHHHDIYQKPLG